MKSFNDILLELIIIKNMEEATKTGIVKKTISSAVSNTSCSSGWLRFAVQAIFCTIIVVCFVTIVMNSYKRSPEYLDKPSKASNCYVANCKVICSQASFNEDYEEDVIFAVMVAQMTCDTISVTLYRPNFINRTTPVNWLSQLQANIASLRIVGGNLNHISRYTFLGSFTKNLKSLELEEVTISDWNSDMLIGLVHLEELVIRDCHIGIIHKNAIRCTDDSLRRLVLSKSGTWKPSHLTGSSHVAKLTEVDFSSNNFKDILSRDSFTELRNCEILRLSSSRITAIQPGTFDFLLSIKIIYLNDNHLTTIPSGLFNRIIKATYPKPQIDLQNNLLHCNCQQYNKIMQLYNKGVLLTEPLCYVPGKFEVELLSNYRSYCFENSSKLENGARNKTQKNVYTNSSVYSFKDGTCKSSRTNTDNEEWFEHEMHNCSDKDIQYVDVDSDFPANVKNRESRFYLEMHISFHNYGEKSNMLEINLFPDGNGLLWFQSGCPEELHCNQNVPEEVMIHNIELKVAYTICPIFANVYVRKDKCIVFTPIIEDLTEDHQNQIPKDRLMFYLFGVALIGAGGLGAMTLYGVILKRPTLMRGSKRVLIVKNKLANAVVLPPKIPLRSLPEPPIEEKHDVLPNPNRYLSPTIPRSRSLRSYKSNAPSYISAIQPTEDQLMQWRLKQHFNNDHKSDTISFVYEGDSIYNSIPPVPENIYEHPITPQYLRKVLKN